MVPCRNCTCGRRRQHGRIKIRRNLEARKISPNYKLNTRITLSYLVLNFIEKSRLLSPYNLTNKLYMTEMPSWKYSQESFPHPPRILLNNHYQWIALKLSEEAAFYNPLCGIIRTTSSIVRSDFWSPDSFHIRMKIYPYGTSARMAYIQYAYSAR